MQILLVAHKDLQDIINTKLTILHSIVTIDCNTIHTSFFQIHIANRLIKMIFFVKKFPQILSTPYQS